MLWFARSLDVSRLSRWRLGWRRRWVPRWEMQLDTPCASTQGELGKGGVSRHLDRRSHPADPQKATTPPPTISYTVYSTSLWWLLRELDNLPIRRGSVAVLQW